MAVLYVLLYVLIPSSEFCPQCGWGPQRGPGGVQSMTMIEPLIARAAKQLGLDLVEVSPNAEPPVCKVLDYGKYKYDRKKKNAQSTHTSKTKEIRLRPKTGQHDIDFKVRKAKDFLEHKDKVQVSVIFRGREMAHIEEGRKVMDAVIEQLAEIGKIEQEPSRMGRRMTCLIVPK